VLLVDPASELQKIRIKLNGSEDFETYIVAVEEMARLDQLLESSKQSAM
jgi:hypothetical protein